MNGNFHRYKVITRFIAEISSKATVHGDKSLTMFNTIKRVRFARSWNWIQPPAGGSTGPVKPWPKMPKTTVTSLCDELFKFMRREKKFAEWNSWIPHSTKRWQLPKKKMEKNDEKRGTATRPFLKSRSAKAHDCIRLIAVVPALKHHHREKVEIQLRVPSMTNCWFFICKPPQIVDKAKNFARAKPSREFLDCN